MIGKFIRDINCVKFCGFAGQNKQRLDHGFHRLALLGIEFVQEVDHVKYRVLGGKEKWGK
jgi:hypothetical protein